jgi:hypothetical protein
MVIVGGPLVACKEKYLYARRRDKALISDIFYLIKGFGLAGIDFYGPVLIP